VYLEGFANIDIWREGFSFLASERPDLVSRNRTTFSKYYKDEITKNAIMDARKEPRYVVADRFQDITALDYPHGSAELIVCVQTLEHLTREEVDRALNNWQSILKPGAVLHIDVPDFEETAKLLLAQESEEAKEWYYRLIYGSQKDNFSIHKDGYSEKKLGTILTEHGFKDIRRLPDTRHFYPSIIMESSK
jgi:SAM-dependent methyltransferase